MRVLLRRIPFLLGLVVGLTAPAGVRAEPSPATVPAEAFFGFSNLRQPRLSPDGTKIAFLYPFEGRLALGVFDRRTNEAKMVVRGLDESLDSFVWKGNENLIFLADYQGNEAAFIGVTDLAGKRRRRIAETYGVGGYSGSNLWVVDWLPHDPENIIIDGFLKRPDTVAMALLSSYDGRQVRRLNVLNNRPTTVFRPPTDDRELYYAGFVADGRGQLRFATTVRNRVVKLLYRDRNDADFVSLREEERDLYLERWARIDCSADGQHIYVISHEEHDRGALYEFDAPTRRLGPALFVPPAGEINELIWSPDGNTLTGVGYEDTEQRYHWFDPAEAALHAKLQASFPGLMVRVTSSSQDGQVRLVWVGSDREPGVYFVLDLKAGSMAQFKRVRDGIDPRLMAPMQPIQFTARDGLEIHGYLTVPTAHAGKPGPLVVLPHGGPFGVRDSLGFDPEVQFLASRGYAVLQINYRGSGGFGHEFLRKGRRQWGRAMQDDLTDGVKWAIAQGFADPSRVAICGASYGGFAAMAGVTLTPELYRCAVNYLGPVDLEITGRSRGADAWLRMDDFDYRTEWIGETKDYRDAGSPLRHVENIRVPTLHAYGLNDVRVQQDHWNRLEAALKKHGKPYEVILSKRAGHGFSDPAEAIAFYTKVEQFLARNLAR